jgi:hypothetical protein
LSRKIWLDKNSSKSKHNNLINPHDPPYDGKKMCRASNSKLSIHSIVPKNENLLATIFSINLKRHNGSKNHKINGLIHNSA